MSQSGIQAAVEREPDDAGFGQFDQRSVNLEMCPALDAGLCRQIAQRLEGPDEFRPAVRVT